MLLHEEKNGLIMILITNSKVTIQLSNINTYLNV